MKATIRDVAKEANVSVGTVSRYLNGQQLKKSNMEAVEKAIKKLEYKENIIAKGMKNNITKSVGVVINTLTDIFATSIVTSLESILEINDYSLVICDYQQDEEKLEHKLKFLRSRNVDAIVLFHVEDNLSVLDDFREANIPILSIDCPISNGINDAIVIDNYDASYQALDILYSNNHTDIGIIAGSLDRYTGRERFRGCEDFFKQHNKLIDDHYVYYGNYQKIDGYDAMNYFLSLKKRPTAIYTINYYMTIGAIQSIHEHGLKIPEDISLVGFDYLDIFDVFDVNITMVEQPLKQIGEKAATMILDRLKSKQGNNQPCTITMPIKMHIGNSVKKIQ